MPDPTRHQPADPNEVCTDLDCGRTGYHMAVDCQSRSALALWQALNRSERASAQVINTAVDWAANWHGGTLSYANQRPLVAAVAELLAARDAVVSWLRAGSEDGAT